MTITSESFPFSHAATPGQDHQPGVPDTSLLPGTDKAPPAAVDLMKRVVQGAHQTIDRLADSATPRVRQLGESVSSAGDALQAKSDQLRETRDEWAESLRCTVRQNPLTAVVASLALGALIARITR